MMRKHIPAAVISDPPPIPVHAARMASPDIPSHGAKMYAVIYIAAGQGTEPDSTDGHTMGVCCHLCNRTRAEKVRSGAHLSGESRSSLCASAGQRPGVFGKDGTDNASSLVGTTAEAL
jgi:hypothetical protein